MSATSRALVTLVTPAYNQAEYLRETLESVLRQAHAEVEYLVLDDGSTDGTAEVLGAYSERLSWESQSNMGQSATLNKGWLRAKGDIIGYISSDDLLEPDAVAEAVRVLQQHPEVVAVYCDFELIDAKGARIRTVHTREYSEREMVEDLVCFPGPGAFFRRSVFAEIGGWNAQLRQVPDFDFWLRLSQHGLFQRIPKVLAHYRIHEDSASYRPTTPERSDEIIAVTQALWQTQGARLRAQGYSQARSLSMAQLIAARSHFASSRLLRGLSAVGKAWRLAPARLLDGLAWRILIGGLVRRPIYFVRTLLTRKLI